jgi:ubiquitin-like protein Pup
MADSSRAQRKKIGKTEDIPPGGGPIPSSELARKGEKIKKDLDKLLDEIDDLLEENAEEFVRNYVQKGGQ